MYVNLYRSLKSLKVHMHFQTWKLLEKVMISTNGNTDIRDIYARQSYVTCSYSMTLLYSRESGILNSWTRLFDPFKINAPTDTPGLFLTICLCPSIWISFFVFLSVCLSISVYLSLYVCFSLYHCLTLFSLSLSVCLSLSLLFYW